VARRWVGWNYRTFGKGAGGVVAPGDTWLGVVARRWVGTPGVRLDYPRLPPAGQK